jgi:hypothetical protein
MEVSSEDVVAAARQLDFSIIDNGDVVVLKRDTTRH